MSDIKVLKVHSAAYHRNGICGEPFQVAVYDAMVDGDQRRMVTVRFYDDPNDPDQEAELSVVRTCTFETRELDLGDVGFGQGNSWRGDQFACACQEQGVFKEPENE